MEHFDWLPADLVASYRSRNAGSYTMSADLDLERDYAFMTEEEFDEIFRQGGAIRSKTEAK